MIDFERLCQYEEEMRKKEEERRERARKRVEQKEATPHTEEPTKSTITNPGISITNLLKETEFPSKRGREKTKAPHKR